MRLAQEKRQSSRTGARLRGTARFVSAVAIAATGLGALAATGPALGNDLLQRGSLQ